MEVLVQLPPLLVLLFPWSVLYDPSRLTAVYWYLPDLVIFTSSPVQSHLFSPLLSQGFQSYVDPRPSFQPPRLSSSSYSYLTPSPPAIVRMYLDRRQDTTCSPGKQWYVCTGKGLNFKGCCSVQACTQDGCPDTPVPSSASELPNQSRIAITAPTTLSYISTTSLDILPPISTPTSPTQIREFPTSPIFTPATAPRSETSNSATVAPALTPGKSYASMIGGTVGGLVGASLLGIMVWVLLRKRKERKESRQQALSKSEKYGGPFTKQFVYDGKRDVEQPLTRGESFTRGDDVFAEFGGRYKSPPQISSATIPPLPRNAHKYTHVPTQSLEIRTTLLPERHTPSPAPSEAPLPDPEKSHLTPPPEHEHPAFHPLPGQTVDVPAYHPGEPATSPRMSQHPAFHIAQISKHPAFRTGPPMSQSPPKHSSPPISTHSNSPPLNRSTNESPSKNLIPRRSSEVREGRTYLDNSPPSRRATPPSRRGTPPSRRGTPPSRRASPNYTSPTRRQTPPSHIFHALEPIPSPYIPPVQGRVELPAEVPVSFVMPSPSAIPAPLNITRRNTQPTSPTSPRSSTLKPITSKFSLQNLSTSAYPITRGNTEASTYSIPIGLGFSSPSSAREFGGDLQQSSVYIDPTLQTPCATPETPSLPSPAALKPAHRYRNSKDLEISMTSPTSQDGEQMVGPIGPSLTSPTPSFHMLGQATAGYRAAGAKMVRIKEHAHSQPYPMPKPTPELKPWPAPEPTPPQQEYFPSTSTHLQPTPPPLQYRRSFEEKIPYHPTLDLQSNKHKNGSPKTHNQHSTSLPDLRPLQALTPADVPITLQSSILSHVPSKSRLSPNLHRASEELNRKWINELAKKSSPNSRQISENWASELEKPEGSPPNLWGDDEKELMKERDSYNGSCASDEKEVVVENTTQSPVTPRGLGMAIALRTTEMRERWSGATMCTPLMGIDGELMSAVESERGIFQTATPLSAGGANSVVSPRTPGTVLGLGLRSPLSEHIVSPRTPGTAIDLRPQGSTQFPDLVSPRTPGTALLDRFPNPPPHSEAVQQLLNNAQSPRSIFSAQTPRSAFASPDLRDDEEEGDKEVEEEIQSAGSSEMDMRERLEESIALHEEQAALAPMTPAPNLPEMTPLSEISLGSWGRASWIKR